MVKLGRNQLNSPFLSSGRKVMMHSEMRICPISFKTYLKHQAYKKALLTHWYPQWTDCSLSWPHHTVNTALSLCLKLLHILRAWVLLFLDSQILTQCLSHCRHSMPVCWMKSMAWSLFFKSANQGQDGHGKTLGKSFALSKPQFLIYKMGIIRKQYPEGLCYVKCLKDACLNRWRLCVVASLWDGPQGLWPPGIHSLG